MSEIAQEPNPNNKRSNALELGPRKKAYVKLQSLTIRISLTMPCSAAIDPLVSHGRHYGRTVHAFCNISVLITNGRTIEDYSAEYILEFSFLHIYNSSVDKFLVAL